MSEQQETILCERHGQGAATFVCTHLTSGVACGFNVSGERPDAPWPDAWCDGCERHRAREGCWNDSSEAQARISLLCSGCYEEVRARNARVPEPLEHGLLDPTPERLRQLFSDASDLSKRVQGQAQERFRIGQWPRWSADWGQGRFSFGTQDHVEVMAEVQIVGSYSTKTRSWLWSWANDTYEAHLVRDIARLSTLGAVRGIEALAIAHQDDREEADCWELTGLARCILGAEAVYRAPMQHLYVFLLLNNLRHVC